MTSTTSQQDAPLPDLDRDLDEAIAWEPGDAYLERSRMRRFMARHGIADYDALLARATADPAWYWGAVAEDLGLVWSTPYDQVLDLSHGARRDSVCGGWGYSRALCRRIEYERVGGGRLHIAVRRVRNGRHSARLLHP